MAVSFRGGVQVPISLGNGAVVQNLFTISNKLGSRVDVNVRRLSVEIDTIAALTAVMPQVKVCRATAISGGIVLAKAKFDTTQSSSEFVEFRSTLAEGAPIAATAGDTIWQQYANRMHTLAEQVQTFSASVLPTLVENSGKEFKLRPGESLLAYVVSSVATSNPAIGNNWSMHCSWEEDEKSTFAISGTVTLSAAPVAGARVIVMESDDVAGTNMFLRETIVTGAGGTWASSILTGKVGAAFVQYETGGTYYTAPGSPYLS